MSIFKRQQNEEEVKETTAPVQEQPAEQQQPEEEWIWVEGYKGTDANMCCRGYQYEIGKQYDMPEGAEVKECEVGFHLCRDLGDVFGYYNIVSGNRFFMVKALVRKKDYDRYGDFYLYSFDKRDKLAAKSIIFISELTRDDILKGTVVEELSSQYKDMAILIGVGDAIRAYKADTLVADGYSAAFAHDIVVRGHFDKAHAVGSQSDLSMDMKVLYILS